MTIGYVAYTKYKRLCPHCGQNFQTVFNPTAQRLGPGSRVCDGCGKSVPDGSIEWPDMTAAQKRKFLYGEIPLLGAIGVLCSAFFMFIFIKNNALEMGFLFVGALVAFGMVLLGVFFLISWADTARSKRRHPRV